MLNTQTVVDKSELTVVLIVLFRTLGSRKFNQLSIFSENYRLRICVCRPFCMAFSGSFGEYYWFSVTVLIDTGCILGYYDALQANYEKTWLMIGKSSNLGILHTTAYINLLHKTFWPASPWNNAFLSCGLVFRLSSENNIFLSARILYLTRIIHQSRPCTVFIQVLQLMAMLQNAGSKSAANNSRCMAMSRGVRIFPRALC